MTVVDRQARIRDGVAGLTEALRTLSLAIHERPELRFEEQHAHGLLCDFLETRGFAVERGAYALPTAFRAVRGSGNPTVAVLCEYDALPDIGHACGHNLIAAAGVAAGLALADALEPGEGTVVVLGTPAEEGGGGKILMFERGAFDDIDAALMLHPGPLELPWPNFLVSQRVEVEYFGRPAHAAARPSAGVNALDALVTAYQSVGLLRQQLRPRTVVHGIITKGGSASNIIPDHTAAEFGVRALNDADFEDTKQRVSECFEGAARATGCRVELRWRSIPYSNLATNEPLIAAYVASARSIGRAMPERPADISAQAGGSTDMGNVSHVVPAIHPMFAIESAAGNHTREFTAAAATPEAHAEMLQVATALALTAFDVCTQPELLEAARTAFRQDHPAHVLV